MTFGRYPQTSGWGHTRSIVKFDATNENDLSFVVAYDVEPAHAVSVGIEAQRAVHAVQAMNREDRFADRLGVGGASGVDSVSQNRDRVIGQRGKRIGRRFVDLLVARGKPGCLGSRFSGEVDNPERIEQSGAGEAKGRRSR